MRTFERRFNETELEFIERVNTTLMDDFAAELMKKGKIGTEGVTIIYKVRKDDLDIFDIDDLFYWESYDNDEEYTYMYISTSCEQWEAWNKARETTEEWIVELENKAIFNILDDRRLGASEVWKYMWKEGKSEAEQKLIDNRLIRIVVADDILKSK